MDFNTIGLIILLVIIIESQWAIARLRYELKNRTHHDVVVDRKPKVVPEEDTPIFQVGDRVRVNDTAGFHRGATGEVVFQEPSGKRCWVLRDGASSPCFYYNYELES